MANKVLFGGITVLLGLAGALTWWVMSTSPSVAVIAAHRQEPPALPSINLQLLENGALTNRTQNGTLPITIQGEGIGRTDPFAGA